LTVERSFGKQTGATDPFSNLLPTTYRQMQREIDRIARLKKIVPALTVIVFIALVLWPVLNSKEGSFTLAIDRLEVRDENAKLVKPRYVSMDRYNQPVNISAEMAFRKSNDDTDYYLKNLLADMKMRDGTDIKIQATSGMFDSGAQEINLDGTVKISTQNDFNLVTEQATFLINEKIATGENGVTGTTSFGVFNAEKFHMDVEQEILRLKGKVTLHFDPDKTMELPKFNSDIKQ